MVALNDFLAGSDADLLAYLQEHKLPDGSVDMSRIARFEEISGEQRATLGSRFEKLEEIANSRNVDHWLSGVGRPRNYDTSSDSDQSSDFENIRPSLRRPLYPRGISPTPGVREPDEDEAALREHKSEMGRLIKCESACYEELCRIGVPPVTTVEALQASGFESMPTYEAHLPWHAPAVVSEDFEYTTVFRKQIARWWHFQKSQWHYRNIMDDEQGLVAFADSRRRIDTIIRDDVDITLASYDAALCTMWASVNDFPFIAEAEAIIGRQHTVKKDVAPYGFRHLPGLKANPLQQNQWANWMEYLSFELQSLRALDRECHEIRNRFNGFSVTLGHERHKLFYMPAPQSLEALDTMNEVAHSIQESIAEFRQKHAELYDIRLRVSWIVGEAHRMDAELTEKENESLKRKRMDDGLEEESENREQVGVIIDEETESRDSKRRRMDANDEHDTTPKAQPTQRRCEKAQVIQPPRRSSRISARKQRAQEPVIIETTAPSHPLDRPTTSLQAHA